VDPPPHDAASAVRLHQLPPAPIRPVAIRPVVDHNDAKLVQAALPLQQNSPAPIQPVGSRPEVEHIDVKRERSAFVGLPQAPVWRTIPAVRPIRVGASPYQNQVWGGPARQPGLDS
jgi:hypothetical protein